MAQPVRESICCSSTRPDSVHSTHMASQIPELPLTLTPEDPTPTPVLWGHPYKCAYTTTQVENHIYISNCKKILKEI